MVARECPYWSPVTRKAIAENYAEQLDACISEYEAVGRSYGFVHRQENCPYYNQYQAYLKEGIAIVMDSALWDIETFSGRKVRVPVEIIDEGNAYLDSLCFRVSVSEERLKTIFKKYGDIIEDDFREDLLKEFNRIVESYAGYTGSVEPVKYLLDLLIELQGVTGELNRIKIIGMYEDEAYVAVKDRVMFYLAEPSFVLRELREKRKNSIYVCNFSEYFGSGGSLWIERRICILFWRNTFSGNSLPEKDW